MNFVIELKGIKVKKNIFNNLIVRMVKADKIKQSKIICS